MNFNQTDYRHQPEPRGYNITHLQIVPLQGDNYGQGFAYMASSKSRLYEICAANRWKPPSFECYEEGPGHKRLFTFKVTVEVQSQDSTTDLECWGSPCLKKKTAAQEAAEGALCPQNLWQKKKLSSSTSLKEIVVMYLAFFFTVRRSIRVTRVSFAEQFDTKQDLGMNPWGQGPAIPMGQHSAGLTKPHLLPSTLTFNGPD
ncbi:hypothetical protein Vadar_011177 [Vaccinium darrowii]|uniref:Uncharacterized protein n=1 Tax=Vaccinium darrowii TaxID=229202 RepID=A0ACB7ZIC8_9ERIC|nr:hypothetical protein Vadar_011177 [Vaccinium darrowii]